MGVGFHALFAKMEPGWLPRAVATGFFLLATVIIVLAERRAAAVMKRLSPHVVVTARTMNLRLITASVAISSAVLIAAIWLAI